MSAVVELQQVRLSYGSLQVLDGITLQVNEGECLGLIGRNGSGKSVLLRLIAGLEAPSSGYVRVCGLDVSRHPQAARRKVGYLPEEFGVYPDLTVWEYLDFFGRCYGLSGEERKASIESMLHLVDLYHLRHAEAASLSRGLRRRLGLARALLPNPPVLLLDDPFADLDDQGRMEFIEVLTELRAMDTAVVLAARHSQHTGHLCSSFAWLEDGRITERRAVDHGAGASLPEEQVVVGGGP